MSLSDQVSQREMAICDLANLNEPGQAFFEGAIRTLAFGLGMRWAGIGLLDRAGQPTVLVALCDGESLLDVSRFSCSAGALAANCIRTGDSLFFSDSARAELLKSSVFEKLDVRAFRSVVFRDHSGQAIGHVFAMHDQPVRDDTRDESFCKLVARLVEAEFQRREAAVSESQHILENTGEPIAIFSADYQIEFMNRAFANQFEIASNALGNCASAYFHPQAFAVIKRQIERTFAGEVVDELHEIHNLRGTRGWVHFKLLRSPNYQNRVVVFSRQVSPVTPEHEEIAELSASRFASDGELRSLLPEILKLFRKRNVTLDVDIWLQDDSKHCLRSVAKPGRAIREISIADTCKLVQSVVAGETVLRTELDHDEEAAILRERQLVTATANSVLAVPLYSMSKSLGFIVIECAEPFAPTAIAMGARLSEFIVQVISNLERRELSARVTRRQRLENLGLVAGGIAHDLSNLLVPVLCSVELALTKIDTDSQAGRALQTAENATLMAADFCSQVLSVAGQPIEEFDEIDLANLITKSTEIARISVGNRAQLIISETSSNLRIRGDAGPLQQAIVNLIQNSADAAKTKDAEIKIDYGLATDLEETEWRSEAFDPNRETCFICVSDNGIGMDDDAKAKVLEPFFTTKTTGNGLGLCVVQNAVRSHHGAMAIQSEPHVGTAITIYIPLEPPETSLPVEELIVDDEEEEAFRRVLVADMNPFVRGSLKAMLDTAGFEVEVARNSTQVIEQIESGEAFDIVVLDTKLTVHEDGESCVKKLRASPNIFCILISDAAHVASDQDIITLQKPIRSRDLAVAIRTRLMKRR